MSLEPAQEVSAAPSGNAPSANTLSGNSRMPVHFHSAVLDHVDQVTLAAANQEDTTSQSTHRPPRIESQQTGADSPAIEESVKARLERLGRQRPEVFESIWAEIGFVFSISMSQVLSVSQKSSNSCRPFS